MSKYLTRKKVYERLPPSKDAKKIYIYCEGEDREVQYFCYFQGFSSNINIIPIPNENGKSDPTKLLDLAKNNFFDTQDSIAKYSLDVDLHDEVWFAIDTDLWNIGNKITQLRDFCQQKNSDCSYRVWNVAQSNPCFEIWLYYHFFEMRPTDEDVAPYLSMKDFVNEKVKGGFDNRSMPIKIETAIKNSKKSYRAVGGQPDKYCTELYLLGDVIWPFIKEQIQEAKSKNVSP